MRFGLERSAGSGYGHLRETAARLVAASADGLDDAALACALFGTLAGDRWHALLGPVLAGDPRLRYQEGRWRIVERDVDALWATGRQAGEPLSGRVRCATIRATIEMAPIEVAPTGAVPLPDHLADPVDAPNDALDAPILALALATTGADPHRHRILRIAVVRRERGEVTARFDAEVGGEWRATRRADRDLGALDAFTGEAPPPFEDVLQAALDLIGDQPVYAYGARRAWAFLDAERRRAGQPELELRLLELDDRIREIVPRSRKPSLLAVAEALGLPEVSRGSTYSEADLVARVLARLRERGDASPPRAALASDLSVPPPHDSVVAVLPFTQEWLAAVPEGPGVYVVEDAAGAALYVGKAVVLRTRLAAYVSKPLSLHRRLEALGVRAAGVRTVEVPSDLEATLLEGWLIRQLQPAFNTAREIRPAATIIRAAPDDPTPRVQLVGAVREDGARYFGPFESTSATRHAADVCRAVYPAAFERRRGDVAAHREAVLAVTLLLSGMKDAAVGDLRRALGEAAAGGDRAEVGRLRAVLRDVQALTMRPSVLLGVAPGWRLLVLEQLSEISRARLHLIHDGRLVASADTDRSTLPARPHDLLLVADAMQTEAGKVDADEDWSPADEATLMRWLVQARRRLAVARVPSNDGA